MKCNRCELCKSRRHIVRGKGRLPNKFLIIGEFPSKSDDLLNELYTGPSGRLLDFLLIKAGIDTRECYYTTCVWCRPAVKKGGTGRLPIDSELVTCAKNVMEVYDTCRPKGVILVGKIAQEFYGKTFSGHCYIYSPEWLLRQGGSKSEYFTMARLKLEKFTR